jgi:SAM-dependent methyltransferase
MLTLSTVADPYRCAAGMSRRTTTDREYVASFSDFLAVTNEKDVLADALIRHLRANHASSLLDVGAGSGELGRKLADVIPSYLAVEARPEYLRRLRDLGLDATRGTWPIQLDRTFDAVLMSHVLGPHHDLREMLRSALRCLEQDGVLLLVLHRIAGTSWAELLGAVSIRWEDEGSLPGRALETLRELGCPTSSECVRTTVETRSVPEMLAALQFVAGGGDADRNDNFAERCTDVRNWILDRCGRSDGSIAFPFEHLIISAWLRAEVAT